MKYFRKIRIIVFSTDMPLWKYCLLTFVILFSACAIVNICISASNKFLMQNDITKEIEILSIRDLVIISFIVPLIETILLSIFLILLKKIINRNIIIAAITALIIGLIHSKQNWTQFFIYALMFYFYAYFYLIRSKNSFSNGFIAALTPHILNNSLIALVTFFDI